MSAFSKFCDRLHAHLSVNPNRRVSLGLEDRLAELPDPSEHARQLRLGEAAQLREELARVAPAGFDEKLDLELASLLLEAEVHNDTYTWAGGTRAEHTPSAGEDIGSGIFLLLSNDPRPAAERLADVTGRIEQIPEYLGALLTRLVDPLARWVQMDQAKVRGLDSLFQTASELGTASKFPDQGRLVRAIATANQALETYLERLSTLPTLNDLFVGPAVAARIVALRGIELELGELHLIARRFLATITSDIEELRAKLVAKYGLDPSTSVERLEAYLNRRFAVLEPGQDLKKILERYQQELANVTKFVDSTGLFPLFDEQEIKIIQTPPFMLPSIPAGAMLPPAPFRPGRPTSQIYLTLSDALLDEHTALSIPSMIIHEAMPGHHLQLAYAAQHTSVVRKHFEAMDQAEGWTTMLEDYMLDLGYMQSLTDEARFIGKRDISRIGARVAIDLYFMTGERDYLDLGLPLDPNQKDPFKLAAELLRATTGFSPGRVEVELNWYSQERGYPLCYLTGNHLAWQLKREVQASQGRSADARVLDRRFHEVYLRAGNMPLAALRRVYQEQGLIDP